MTEPPDAVVPVSLVPGWTPVQTPEQIAKAERANRLAKALRDNLRRRKAVQPKRDRPGN
jgi:hypothetical protein